MTERQFQTELIRGLRYGRLGDDTFPTYHVAPIPDSGGGERFGTERVYDLGIQKDGVYYAVELKRATTSLPFKELKTHQRAYLAESAREGGIPLVVCFFEHTGQLVDNREPYRRSRKTYEGWAVTLDLYLWAEGTLPRKSTPLNWWRERGIELLPIKTPAFDKDGKPKFSKTGKREWNWGWDFRAVHEVFRRAVAA